jgi:hypothetical protein
MYLLIRLLCGLALLVLPTIGCAQVTDGGPEGSALLSVAVASADFEPTGPLEGAEFCETGTDNCVFTDATGLATLELPIGPEVRCTLEKEGHGSYLVAEVMPAGGEQYAFSMGTHSHLAGQFQRIDSPYPMRLSGTVVIALVPRFAGATFELDDATGKPFYHDEEGRRSLDLTETTAFGLGGFAEISPGEFQVNLGGTAERCVPGIGWPGNVANSVRFPIREGYITYVSIFCPPPQ